MLFDIRCPHDTIVIFVTLSNCRNPDANTLRFYKSAYELIINKFFLLCYCEFRILFSGV